MGGRFEEIDDVRVARLLATELNQLQQDAKRTVEACDAINKRMASVSNDVMNIGDALKELQGTSTASGSDARTLSSAGASSRRLLGTMEATIGFLQRDAVGMLQYLDASEVLRQDEVRSMSCTSPRSVRRVHSPVQVDCFRDE